jgi:signal transduction histidine kinase
VPAGYRERVQQRLSALLRSHVLDLVIVGLVGGAIVEFVVTRGREDGPAAPLALAVPVIALMLLPLLARRRYPFGAPAFAVGVGTAASFVEGRLVPYLFFTFVGILVIAFLFAYLNDRRHAVVGLLLVLGTAAIVTRNDPQQDWVDSIFIAVILALAWLGGVALNERLSRALAAETRAARLEREREEQARRAVAEERTRIARELHDVIAHSVSVMTVQASGVRRLLLPEQEREREALETIERTGREALAEMRRMLGVLRQPTQEPAALAPQPGLDNLDNLVRQVREAGLPVELHVSGERPQLPPGIDLSAYRVVQEALTNALRHAGPARARVDVRFSDDAVELEIANDGRSDVNGNGDGQGLVGMRERVALCGGTVESGPCSAGYAVRARIPLREETSAS